MAYGLSTHAYLEGGPTEQLVRADAARSTARAWRTLDQARRLEAIERALRPANDCGDRFPLAL